MITLEQAQNFAKEIAAVKIAQARALGLTPNVPTEVQAEALEIVAASVGVTESAAAGEWKPGEYVTAECVRTYGGKSYSCVQAHVTQSDWTPGVVAALWKEVKASGSAWVQPSGGHDAHKKGDVVTHGGKTWRSDADNNVWEPGAYGWSEVK